MKLTYAVVFVQTPNNYGAYVPDVPGCVSVGDTWDEMQAMIREALAFHIEDLLESGEPLPEPKMSIDDAIAYHNEPIPEDVLESYAEYGDDTPTLSTRFELCGDRGPGSAAGSGELTLDAAQIPDGWEVVRLETLAEVVMGQSPHGRHGGRSPSRAIPGTTAGCRLFRATLSSD